LLAPIRSGCPGARSSRSCESERTRAFFERPYSIEDAAEIASSWLAHPAVAVVRPGERYWEILRELLLEARVEAALVTDAALAALAIEHGATLCSTDRDFRRFRKLKLQNPLP